MQAVVMSIELADQVRTALTAACMCSAFSPSIGSLCSGPTGHEVSTGSARPAFCMDCGQPSAGLGQMLTRPTQNRHELKNSHIRIIEVQKGHRKHTAARSRCPWRCTIRCSRLVTAPPLRTNAEYTLNAHLQKAFPCFRAPSPRAKVHHVLTQELGTEQARDAQAKL